ncbi:MAG: hypothetical protein QOE36_2590, partial [Gaiellaceae bacterium]|nr:hypothetical protein [Gaiellaceae bacterium]
MTEAIIASRGVDTRPAPAPEPAAVTQLITIVVSLASVCVALTAAGTLDAARHRPTEFVLFLVAALALAPVSVHLYVRGSFSFVGCGILAVGFALGVGPAVFTALLATVIHFVRRPAKLHRMLYTSSMWTLAAVAGTLPYRALGAQHWSELGRVAAAVAGGPLYAVVNLGLLSLVMALSEGESVRAIWRERFRWTLPYYIVSGPLAVALVFAYERLGVIGLYAFALPPWFMMFSVHQYVARTRAAAEEIHEKNMRLEEWNADLHRLFEFASGLAAHATDRTELTRFAEGALAGLTGGHPRLHFGVEGPGVPLIAGGTAVGVLELEPSEEFDAERWGRLSEAILPQLATALESAELVERVRKTHLATIAALSRSMEAKDYYTGGHTERVATISVALATRLGYEGADLDAVEIGALLHDIGKIGIPE